MRRWTKKNGHTYYGYKNHVLVDKDTKFIDCYEVTQASVHDSRVFEDLLSEEPLARTWVGLRNLCYNIRRLKSLEPSLTTA